MKASRGLDAASAPDCEASIPQCETTGDKSSYPKLRGLKPAWNQVIIE
jgi:hypothetical protein